MYYFCKKNNRCYITDVITKFYAEINNNNARSNYRNRL